MNSSGYALAAPRAAATADDSARCGGALLGRTRELAELRELAHGAAGATGGALVLRGEAGAGKTALLAEFARLTGERRLLRLAGIEAEAGMAWAALHRLLLALPAEAGRLSRAQREAVDVAAGIHGGTADPELVRSAVRAALADAAASGGLVCVVDDLQWIDRESLGVLHRVARQARAIPLILVAAACEPAPVPVLAGIPELTVAGLAADAGADLLLRQAGAVLDRRTAEQLTLLVDGNPLTLAETGRRLAAGQADVLDILCGQQLTGLPRPARFSAEIRALPADSQALLALAACAGGGDRRRFWQAAVALRLGPQALTPARRAHVILPGRGVRFRHPLLRAAALDQASPAQWRAAHRALADASGQRAEPATRVWPRAGAAAIPDNEIAAAYYLAAGEAALAASAPRLADDLLRRAQAASGVSAAQPRAQRLAARLDSVLGRRGGRGGHDMLVAAARLARRERQAGLQAMQEAAQFALAAGHYTRGTTSRAIGSALLQLTGDAAGDLPPGALLPGLARLLGGDYRRAVPLLRRALRAAPTSWDSVPGAGSARVYAARALWEDEYLLAGPGAPCSGPGSHDLAATLASAAAALACAGHLDEADWTAGQGRRLARSLGWSQAQLTVFDGAELHAWRGDGAATERAASRQAAAAAELERADLEDSAAAALMTLALSRCQYAQAFAAAERLAATELGGQANQALSVLVEAGSRLGRRDAAERAWGELEDRARASGTAWALGAATASAALLAGDDEAADAYERSVELLDTTGVISERARARLLYGEWLRRRRQRTAARRWLSAACQLFQQMGAAEFARRAQRELDATLPPGTRGEAPSRPSAAPALTLAERRIAELAAAGATNREIAVELFVSRRTVDHHLRNTYGKLGVSSRRQLVHALAPCSPEPCGSSR